MTLVLTINHATTEVCGEVNVVLEVVSVAEQELSCVLHRANHLLTVETVRVALCRCCITLGTEVVLRVDTSTNHQGEALVDVEVELHISVDTVTVLSVDTLVCDEVSVVLTTRKRRILLNALLAILPIVLNPIHINVWSVAPQTVHNTCTSRVSRRYRDVVTVVAAIVERYLRSEPLSNLVTSTQRNSCMLLGEFGTIPFE